MGLKQNQTFLEKKISLMLRLGQAKKDYYMKGVKNINQVSSPFDFYIKSFF